MRCRGLFRGQERGRTWYSKEDNLLIRKLFTGIVVLWNSTSGDIALLLGIGHVTMQPSPLAISLLVVLDQRCIRQSRSSDVTSKETNGNFIVKQSEWGAQYVC